MKKRGIFIKVFVYTVVFSALLVGATAALFWQQLQTYYSQYQIQKIVDTYQRLADDSRLGGDITKIAQRFYERDEAFQFYITDDKSGQIVYKTPGSDSSGIELGLQTPGTKTKSIMIRLDDGYNIRALISDVISVDYGKWVPRMCFILAAMLVVCIAAAFLFARQMTKPIKALADNASKMANMEDVSPPTERTDEIGELARDVHSMYVKLKSEILREAELTESQRYFFSAASHELKTPIAATSILLEGMLASIGDYKDHPKYLRECLKMMDAQSETISEILELVALSDGKIAPIPETIDIKRTVSDLLPNFQTLADSRGQRVVTDIPDGQTCLAAPKLLQRALSNVILNAVQNTPNGGEIRIWSEPATHHYRLCVLNTGTKIDEAVLPKLFDPFYRVDKARSRKSGRSGLGLTIVRKTLEAMSVPFALENTPDGVLFWMDLAKAKESE